MKITICGSIAFYDKMVETKKQLEVNGHVVNLPPSEVRDKNGNTISVQKYYDLRKDDGNMNNTNSWIWDEKMQAIKEHFNKVSWADAILVLNYNKNDIEGYIGANTLMEMGLALYLGKPIYLMEKIPETNCKEEILGMKPILLNGNLDLIK